MTPRHEPLIVLLVIAVLAGVFVVLAKAVA